ncbi:hypothetical protein AAG570_006461 [Ranatra chinensis]|uniref:Uncharacterized protein n=1 Tax=Ranatra chinensis TaxID=642074 RepID=A0ABD0Z6V4_9HEMI
MEEQGEESFNATLKSEEIESREHSVNKHPANKSILSAHGGEVDGAQSVNENPEDEIISSSGGDVDNRQSINENPEEIISSSAAGEVDDRQSVNENPADDIIPSAVGGEVADGQSVTENPADETVLSAIAGEGGDSFSVDVKLLEEIKGRIKLKQFANVMEAFELVMGISIIVMALEKFQDLEPVFKVCPNALLRNLFGQSLFIGVITTLFTSLWHIIGSELIYKPLT